MTLDPIKTRLYASIALGITAMLSTWLYLDAREKEILEKGEMVKIVVANKYIPTYTRLAPEWLIYRNVPRAYVPRGAVENPDEIMGSITLVPFNDLEPIVFNKITDNRQNLSDAIPRGMRAFTLGVDEVTGLSGLLNPGDLVDVFHLVGQKSTALFQSVKVLAVGNSHASIDNNQSPPRTVTLALSPGQCSLAMVSMTQGPLQLALRATGDIRTSSETLSRAFDPAVPRGLEASKNSKDGFTIKKR